MRRSSLFPRFLIPAVLGFSALFFYAPFVCRACVISFDSDALAMVAQLRANPNWVGWTGGYYLNSFLTSVVSLVLNAAGQAWNDYALAYQLVTLGALVGLAVGTYAVVERLTRNPAAGVLAAIAVMTLPGLLRLTLHVEDNLIAAVMQLQYLGVYMWYVTRAARRAGASRADAGVGVSLWLAVIAHHQLNVLWVTPLALFWFWRGELTRAAILRRVALMYASAFGLLLALYVPLTILWTGHWGLRSYLEHVRLWFMPGAFYQGYYFFNQFGWDLARQGNNIATGILALVRSGNDTADVFIGAGYVLLLGLLAVPYRAALRDTRVQVLTLFVLVHIPHSLVYESYNLERWDAGVVPLVALCAVLVVPLWHARGTARGFRRAHIVLTFALAAVLLLYGAYFYVFTIERARRAADNAAWQAVQPVLLSNVQPKNRAPAARRVLLLTAEQFHDFYRVSALYFDYARALYAVTRDGVYFYSPALYPKRADLTPEEFLARTRGAQVVSVP